MTSLSEAPNAFPSIGQRAASSLTSRLLVGSLALSAGIHLAVAYQHGRAGDHGGFFLAVGMAQAVLALLVSRRSSHRRLLAAMTLSLFLVATWAAKTSLLSGITGAATPAAVVDAAATVLEAMAVGAGLVLLRRRRAPSPVRTNVATVVALVALPASGFATLADSHGAHQHDIGEQPVQSTPAAPRPSVFGDLFDDHHTGPTGQEPGAPANPHEGGVPVHAH